MITWSHCFYCTKRVHTQNHKYGVHSRKYYLPVISLTKAGVAEQTADLFSEQTWPCTAEGEPGEENCPNEPGGYCPEGGRNG